MPAGPPTKYTPELLEKARYYIDNYEEYGDKIPSVAGLSIVIGISRPYIYEWDKQEDKHILSDMLREIMALQERKLLNNGLDGTFNPTITKLVLSKHQYHDKVDTALSGAVGVIDLSDKTDEELKAIIKGE